jgi:hypothetical protein
MRLSVDKTVAACEENLVVAKEDGLQLELMVKQSILGQTLAQVWPCLERDELSDENQVGFSRKA